MNLEYIQHPQKMYYLQIFTMGYRKSRLGHRKYCYSRQSVLRVSLPLRPSISSSTTFFSLNDLSRDLKTVDLGQWCLLPPVGDEIHVCKFNSKMVLAVSVNIKSDFKWDISVCQNEILLEPFKELPSRKGHHKYNSGNY